MTIMITVLVTSLGWYVVSGLRRGAAELWLISAVKAPGRMALAEIEADLEAGRLEMARSKTAAFRRHWAVFENESGFTGDGIGNIMVTFGQIYSALQTGRAAPTFELTNESAMDRLMGTRHIAELERRNPAPLTCWIEGTESDARLLYLGEDHTDHSVRVGAYRVTSDGRVWVNADPTLLEDRWATIE